MDEKVEKLLRAYTELDINEKQTFREKLNSYENKDYFGKKEIREGFNKSLGPLMTNSCPYCGK